MTAFIDTFDPINTTKMSHLKVHLIGFYYRIVWDVNNNSSTAVALTFRRYLKSQILDGLVGVLTERFCDLPECVPRNAEIVP